jgi:hypothetical protein
VQLTVIVPDVGGNRRQNNVVKHTNLILFHANGRKVTPPRLRQNNQAVAGINCTDNACFVGSRIIKLNEIGGVLMQNHFLSVSLYKPYEHAATVKRRVGRTMYMHNPDATVKLAQPPRPYHSLHCIPRLHRLATQSPRGHELHSLDILPVRNEYGSHPPFGLHGHAKKENLTG